MKWHPFCLSLNALVTSTTGIETTGHLIPSGIILCLCPANEKQHYIVTLSPIGWAHTQNYPYTLSSQLSYMVCIDSILKIKMFTWYWNHILVLIEMVSVTYHILLTHWGRVMHICVSELTNIGSDNFLSPGRCQAIIWTNAGILLIGPLGTKFNEILIEIHTFSFKKMHFKM